MPTHPARPQLHQANDFRNDFLRNDFEIVITRLLDAPRELVFEVWTDSRHVTKWWGPQSFTCTLAEMDVRPGGCWKLVMHDPDGIDYANLAVYDEITPPRRLAYTHASESSHDFGAFHVASASHVVVTFEARGIHTILTLAMCVDPHSGCAKSTRFRAIAGGNSMLDGLEAYLQTL